LYPRCAGLDVHKQTVVARVRCVNARGRVRPQTPTFGTYRELGPDYFDRLHTERLTRTLVQRLERLGHQVTLRPHEPAA
jgi:hypothetical protein